MSPALAQRRRDHDSSDGAGPEAGGDAFHGALGVVGVLGGMGPLATIDFMRQFKVDIGLIGISAIESDGSLRDYDYREVRVARIVLEQSRETWLAADGSKFGRAAMVELARVDDIARLYTSEFASAR